MFDVPASGKDPDPTYPLVRGKLDADGPRHQPVEIEFTNDSEAPVQATFQPLLLHVDNDENQFFEPERRDAVLLPGETHTAEFTIDTSLVPDNMHYILGVVLANLDVYAGFETTVVGGEAEYYPRQLRYANESTSGSPNPPPPGLLRSAKFYDSNNLIYIR